MDNQHLRLNSIGYVYLTLNMVNRKRYIGVHKVKDGKFDPNYKGSGVLLGRAIEKYGWHNFKTRPIKWCESESELYELEYNLVEKYNCINSDKYYNVHDGGKGGKTWANYSEESQKEIVKEKISKAKRGRPRTPKEAKQLETIHNARIGTHHSEETKRKSRESNLGQKRSEIAKKHMSENHADVSGCNNPCYGKKKMTMDGIKAHFIEESKVQEYLSNGWVLWRDKNILLGKVQRLSREGVGSE